MAAECGTGHLQVCVFFKLGVVHINGGGGAQEVLDICMTRPRQPLKMILQKLRPNYKDKCKIRWLNIPNKVMQGRIRRFC